MPGDGLVSHAVASACAGCVVAASAFGCEWSADLAVVEVACGPACGFAVAVGALGEGEVAAPAAGVRVGVGGGSEGGAVADVASGVVGLAGHGVLSR